MHSAVAADWPTGDAPNAAYVHSLQFAPLPPAVGLCKGSTYCELIPCLFAPVVLTNQVVENWYPGAAKDSKGVLLVVTAGKEGAISGGDKFLGVS